MSKALVYAFLSAAIGSALVDANAHGPTEPYAPFSVPCAERPPVRPATGLGFEEWTYTEAREALAHPARVDEDLRVVDAHSSSAKSAERRRKSQTPATRKAVAVMALSPRAWR